jgi:hypothetical protein
MILYAPAANGLGALLRTPFLVWIGRISYSLYLVHWPIIVFTYAYTYAPPNLWQKCLIIGVSVAAAWLQYQFIEQQFRYQSNDGRSHRTVAAIAAVVMGLVVSVAVAAYQSGGWPQRIPESRSTPPSSAAWRRLVFETYCTHPDDALNAELVTCQNYRNKSQSIFIWGDSHAQHLVPGFSENFPDYNIFVLYLSACNYASGFAGYARDFGDERTADCVARNRNALEYFRTMPPTNIVLSSAQRSTPETVNKATRQIITSLRSAGHNIIVLGDFIRPGIPLADCVTAPSVLVSNSQIASRCAGDLAIIDRALDYNLKFQNLYPDAILPNDIECPHRRCTFFSAGQPLFQDHHHLSIAGSIYLVGRLKPQLPL